MSGKGLRGGFPAVGFPQTHLNDPNVLENDCDAHERRVIFAYKPQQGWLEYKILTHDNR